MSLRTPVIPASCAPDPPGTSLRRPASTGSVPRNEAKLGPGCKQRADGATCAQTGDGSTQLPLMSGAKTVPQTLLSSAIPLGSTRRTEGVLPGFRLPLRPSLGCTQLDQSSFQSQLFLPPLSQEPGFLHLQARALAPGAAMWDTVQPQPSSIHQVPWLPALPCHFPTGPARSDPGVLLLKEIL